MCLFLFVDPKQNQWPQTKSCICTLHDLCKVVSNYDLTAQWKNAFAAIILCCCCFTKCLPLSISQVVLFLKLSDLAFFSNLYKPRFHFIIVCMLSWWPGEQLDLASHFCNVILNINVSPSFHVIPCHVLFPH